MEGFFFSMDCVKSNSKVESRLEGALRLEEAGLFLAQHNL